MRLKLSILMFLIAGNLLAQDNQSDEIDGLIESQIAGADIETDYSEIKSHPLSFPAKKTSFNGLSKIDLYASRLITTQEVDALFLHIQTYGPLHNAYELQTIEELDSLSIATLIQYFSFQRNDWQNFKSHRHKQVLRLKHGYKIEKSLGFTSNDSNRFQGNRSKINLLYQSESRVISFGFHIEKDAGEQAKMNFHSAYLTLKLNRNFENVIVGDQQVAFAQGLLLGTGIQRGKSALVMQIMKQQNQAKAYQSFNENGFIRGVSTQFKCMKKIHTTAVAGIQILDSKIQIQNDSARFGSINLTGYYRNTEEIKTKHQLWQWIAVANSIYRSKNLELGIGLNSHQMVLNPLKYKQNVQLNNPVEISYGLHWKWQYKNQLLFGEATAKNRQDISMVFGLIKALGHKTDLSILYRNYSKAYDQQLSKGFSSASNAANEHGLYLGFCTQLPYKLTFNYYQDIYSYQEAKYQSNGPTYALEHLAEIKYKTKQAFSFYLRYTYQLKYQNEQNTGHLKGLEPHAQENMRLHCEGNLAQIRLRTRLELVKFQIATFPVSLGNLIYQDVQFKVGKKTQITMRYCMFSSDDYNSRIYAFENDVPGSFSIPNFSGKGQRVYALIRYQIQKDLQIWFRFARSIYHGITETGSGLNSIKHPHVSDMSIQLQWKI